MLVDINIRREAGVLKMFVNAKELHNTLEVLGVKPVGPTFPNGPVSDYTVIDLRRNRISTDVLLRREYPATYSLSGIFLTPPTVAQLTKIAQSAVDVTREILEHYQPIDISVKIQPKVVNP